jgi:ABC-type bacteriocin/lantibiotic exporter with double-glycine peptidase domain
VIEVLARYRVQLGLILFATFMEMSFNAAVALSLRFMIDDGLTPHNGRALTITVMLLASGAIVVSMTALGRDRLFAKTQWTCPPK